MDKATNITLGRHFEEFVSKQVREGNYHSASEMVRAGLRLLEERELRLNALRQALEEGEESGTAEYSLEGLLAELDAEGQ